MLRHHNEVFEGIKGTKEGMKGGLLRVYYGVQNHYLGVPDVLMVF